MPNPTTRKLIDFMCTERQPYLTDDIQVVSGPLSLKVFPSIESDVVQSYIFECPTSYELDACTMGLLMFSALFEPGALLDLVPRLRQAVGLGCEFSETIKGWKLRACPQREGWFIMEAISVGSP